MLFSSISISGSASITSQVTSDKISSDNIQFETPPEFKVESTIPINVVFLGTNQSLINQEKIDQDITKFYVPTIAQKGYIGYHANYSLDMNYYYSTEQLELDFLNYIDSIAYQAAPTSDLLNYFDPNASSAFYINASLTLSWLDNNINSYFTDNVNSSYTLYIIDTYSKNYIFDYYFYETSMEDADTGQLSPNTYTNYFGGDYPSRGVFLDLSAGPVYYRMDYENQYVNDNDDDEGVSHESIIPIWQYNFPTATDFFADQLAEYIQETIDLVFVPGYLYIPEIRDSQKELELEIFLFDDASSSVANQLNIQQIFDSFNFLLPYFDISVTYTVTTLADFPGLQDHMNTYSSVNDNGATEIDTREVVNYLMSHQGDFGITDNTFPVYIWAWDDNKWLTSEGTLGVGYDDGKGNPEMVLMGYPVGAGYSYEGYTATTIHEIGHLVSLRHPHDGVSWDRYNDTGNPGIVDWLPDFISTPMTYANPDVSFSTFDADQLDRGFALNRINATWWNLALANKTLIDKNYDLSSLPSSVISALETTLQNLDFSLSSFDNIDFWNAYLYANASYTTSLEVYQAAMNIDALPDPTPSGSTPPSSTVSDIAPEPDAETDVSLPFNFIVVVASFVATYRIRKRN